MKCDKILANTCQIVKIIVEDMLQKLNVHVQLNFQNRQTVYYYNNKTATET